MIADGAVADAKDDGDLLIALALSHPLNDFTLSAREASTAEIQMIHSIHGLPLRLSGSQHSGCPMCQSCMATKNANEFHLLSGEITGATFIEGDTANMTLRLHGDGHLML